MKKKNTLQSSLSKFVAHAGIASRRKVVDLIRQGLIKVNGKIIKEPGYKLQPDDKVTYHYQQLKAVQQKLYILLNKPKDYITTVSDEKGRKTVMDLIKDAVGQRLYPVGRLDRDTTGLLIVTNDGAFAQKLSHPRYEVQKIYTVTLNRILHKDDFENIKEGLQLADGFIKVDAIAYVNKLPRNHVKVMLHSGKNRIVRRIFEYLGYDVVKLDRIGYAGLNKRGLSIGQWRYLTEDEITRLQETSKESK
jgi:23S rRNA pseudouridine2605 synthase